METQLRTRARAWAEIAKIRLLLTTTELTDDQLPFFLKLSRNEKDIEKDMENDEDFRKKASADPVIQLCLGQIGLRELKVNVAVVVFICGWLCRNVTDVIVYMAYIQLMLGDKKKQIGMMELSMLFSEGFFTHKDLTELWELQKLTEEEVSRLKATNTFYTDNLLDYHNLLKPE